MHQWELRKRRHGNKILQRSWDKYGSDAFVFEVVEFVSSKADVLPAEQRWIDAINPEMNILKTAGSCAGRKLSESHINAIKESRKTYVTSPETRAKIAGTLRGRKRPPETVAVRSASPAVQAHLARLHEDSKNRVVTDATRARLSAVHRGKVMSDKAKELIAASKRGVPRSAETKKALSDAAARRRDALMRAGALPNVHWSGWSDGRPKWTVKILDDAPIYFDNLLDAAAARYRLWNKTLAHT